VSGVGGLLGVALGFAGGLAVALAGLPLAFTAWPVLLAFTCAVLTGLLFGLMPAMKAARLDPVVALASD
jgi:macrolide transport system ATP-binding/permease protein